MEIPRAFILSVCALRMMGLPAAAQPATWPPPQFHLTARPWKSTGIQRAQFLDVIEGVVRYSRPHQSSAGAVIDPFLHREHQYATPYYAYALGTLIAEGRARDLLPSGIAAMEHATRCFGDGRKAVPDEHGEFFIAALTGAMPLYEKFTPAAQFAAWRLRLRLESAKVIQGNKNNWETYIMKGDWMRQQAGLIPRAAAVEMIENAWVTNHSQRISPAPLVLYHDRTSDPDTLNVEAVGRGNLLALTHLGYDGPSAAAIRRFAEQATRNTLYLADPSGQAPTNGRTDNHVWVEIGYQLAFEVMAERAFAAGDLAMAGQYRRAASLAFQSAQRWRRTDGAWAGSFFVTKNRMDPSLRVGHQTASQYSNYNGSLMFHLAEAFHIRHSSIAEQPTPAELGGYAMELDSEFASAFANAGGMQVQMNLRGQEKPSSGNLWTPLGIVRFARSGWETRLGPSDGALIADGGLSFGPAFEENGSWLRLADLSARYEGRFEADFTHPLLVRCTLHYSPKQGQSGPSFRITLTVTPDGVLARVQSTNGGGAWGVSWPLLVNDGQSLQTSIGVGSATTAFANGSDDQNFLLLHGGEAPRLLAKDWLSTYGNLREARVVSRGLEVTTFVYPRSAGDPAADEVLRSFRESGSGFRTLLGRVDGDQYVGRTAAGGKGSTLDIDGDGKPELQFSSECNFVAQLAGGRVTAVEADRLVDLQMGSRKYSLRPFVPQLMAR